MIATLATSTKVDVDAVAIDPVGRVQELPTCRSDFGFFLINQAD